MEGAAWHPAPPVIPPSPPCAGPPLAPGPRALAALAGLDDHVGELLHLGGAAHVVEDGEGLQVLGNTAGGGGGLGVQGVVQAQQLPGREGVERGGDRSQIKHNNITSHCVVSLPPPLLSFCSVTREAVESYKKIHPMNRHRKGVDKFQGKQVTELCVVSALRR